MEETERLLTGAQMADSRVKRNLDLIRTGYNVEAINAAIDGIVEVIEAREEAVQSPMFSDIGGKNKETPVPAATPTGKTVIRYDAQGNRIK